MNTRAPLVMMTAIIGAGAFAACTWNQPIPEKRIHHLSVERQGDALQACSVSLEVRRVRVAPAFERKSLVVETDAGGFFLLPYDEFAAPPGMEFRAALLDWLRASGIAEHVLEPGEGRSDWILEAELEQLYASRTTAHLAARFALSERANLESQRLWRYEEVAPTTGPSARAFVGGWNAAAAGLFARLEHDLHAFFLDRGHCTPPPVSREADAEERVF